MPHIAINLYPGRDEALKQEFADKVKDLFVDDLGFPSEHISVSVVENSPEAFVSEMEKIYDKKDLANCKMNMN